MRIEKVEKPVANLHDKIEDINLPTTKWSTDVPVGSAFLFAVSHI